MIRKITLDKKILNIWVAIGLFVLLTFAMIVLLRSVKGDGIWEETILSFLFFFLFPVIFSRYFFKKSYKFFFLDVKKSKKVIEWSLSLALVGIFFIWIFVLKLNKTGMVWGNGTMNLLLFVNSLFLPVIVFSREFFFRGFLLKIFLEKLSVFWSIFLQSFLFVIFSLLTNFELYNIWRVLTLFIMSFGLGILAIRTRSIIVSSVVCWGYLFLVDLYVAYGLNNALLRFIIEKNN